LAQLRRCYFCISGKMLHLYAIRRSFGLSQQIHLGNLPAVRALILILGGDTTSESGRLFQATYTKVSSLGAFGSLCWENLELGYFDEGSLLQTPININGGTMQK